ncbi:MULTISPECIES: YobA family protein [unclassified Exiguobacterium]|uniref:YobA family protein n=1 Tax=unclassified Exiguobacterium TaxID=2644629 RepID=UPI001BE505D5|nr:MULTISPECIES: YobA family protein [unclassified Exiguobacterium]
MATFSGYVAEVMEEKIRVTPTREAEPFDGIVFHVTRLLLDETPLLVGQRVRIEHDERLTRSLPPQTTAYRIVVL